MRKISLTYVLLLFDLPLLRVVVAGIQIIIEVQLRRAVGAEALTLATMQVLLGILFVGFFVPMHTKISDTKSTIIRSRLIIESLFHRTSLSRTYSIFLKFSHQTS